MRVMRKLISTIRLCATMLLARTFGEYVHSGWNGEHDYCAYRWHGKVWRIPTGPCEETTQ